MQSTPEVPYPEEHLIQRLTALWGLTEAGLGGVIHSLRIPFTGIVVGSTAIILITLIAFFGRKRPAVILRSTAVVLIIKAGVSPHTPIPAYIAVLFQGCMAAWLFRCLPGIRLPAMILGIAGLIEGVCQKFISMTIVYGKSVWEAIDLLGRKLSTQWGLDGSLEHASAWLIGIFVIYYGIGGIITGWLAGIIPLKIQELLRVHQACSPAIPPAAAPMLPRKTRRHWPYRRLLPAALILVMIVLVYGLLYADTSYRSKILYILCRTLLVLGAWFFLLGPLIRKWIHQLQKKKHVMYGEEVSQALHLMPHIRKMAGPAWAETVHENRFVRWYHFLIRWVVYSIAFDENARSAKDT